MLSSASFSFIDPHQYQATLRAADVEFMIMARGEFWAELTRIDLHRLWMQRGSQALPCVTHAKFHKDRCPIFFPADALQPPLQLSGKTVSPGDLIFHSPGAEHHHRFPAGCRWAAMSLTPEDLCVAGEALGYNLKAPAATLAVRPRPQLIARLMTLHRAAGDLAAAAPEVLAHPEVARATEQALVHTMVACLVDNQPIRSDYSRRQDAVIMRRFDGLIEEQRDEPLYVLDVCAKLGVTARTLRSYCHGHLGMGPHRYLWLRRMNLARQALASADASTTTVTRIAMSYGFGELGRFAVEYRKLFGEVPSATLHRSSDAVRLQEIETSAHDFPFLHSRRPLFP
ncbi:MAG: helix-turn-helix domain-containing protein [Acetobacteraceae bacterium]|nr:helix-turn-helix domain-containing protein [Acetobacteraceae bacterium]